MDDPVNLNKFRKKKRKEEKKKTADENRVKHGLSKSDKSIGKAKLDRVEKKLDQHKRNP